MRYVKNVMVKNTNNRWNKAVFYKSVALVCFVHKEKVAFKKRIYSKIPRCFATKPCAAN